MTDLKKPFKYPRYNSIVKYLCFLPCAFLRVLYTLIHKFPLLISKIFAISKIHICGVGGGAVVLTIDYANLCILNSMCDIGHTDHVSSLGKVLSCAFGFPIKVQMMNGEVNVSCYYSLYSSTPFASINHHPYPISLK